MNWASCRLSTVIVGSEWWLAIKLFWALGSPAVLQTDTPQTLRSERTHRSGSCQRSWNISDPPSRLVPDQSARLKFVRLIFDFRKSAFQNGPIQSDSIQDTI